MRSVLANLAAMTTGGLAMWLCVVAAKGIDPAWSGRTDSRAFGGVFIAAVFVIGVFNLTFWLITGRLPEGIPD